MSGRMLTFGLGAAIGYVLGTRAGRERFERMANQAKRIWQSDVVQEAAGVAQVKAGQLYDEAKKMTAGQPSS